MNTGTIKGQVDKNIEKLMTLRDEVKVRLHLASLEAKQEWSEKLEPRVFEVEQTAKSISDSSKSGMNELVSKLEDFLGRIRDVAGLPEHITAQPPQSTH